MRQSFSGRRDDPMPSASIDFDTCICVEIPNHLQYPVPILDTFEPFCLR